MFSTCTSLLLPLIVTVLMSLPTFHRHSFSSFSSISSVSSACASAQQLTIRHYQTSPDCASSAPSLTRSYALDSCYFGAGGKTSSRYLCNATHARMLVYLKSSSCESARAQDVITTEAELDKCHRIISTSMQFVCAAGRVWSGGIALILSICFVMMTMMW